jgi:hypothetical protein
VTRPARGHANFSDPFGLIVRMLRSGDPAARAALLREASAAILSPLDRCLQIAEHRRLRSAQPSMLPLLLIVGAPRSGTTLVYQVLARHLPFTYFTNLSALFPRAPLTASRLLLRGPRTAPDSLHNYYGNTAGLTGPNDGFHIWNRWLGADRYQAPQSLPAEAVTAMRRFFAAWTAAFGRPLVNKNNRNTDCVGLLGQALPEAVFVVIHRDPVYVAQSLLLARQHVQGDKRRRWGLRSLDQEVPTDPLGHVDSVCRQVTAIADKLQADCRSLPAARFIDVHYEEFCADPDPTLETISSRVWGASGAVLTGRKIGPVGATTNRQRISPAEFERIQSCLRGRSP